MIVIGVSGFARTGKDLYCNIAKNFFSLKGLRAKRYAFAYELKRDVEPFLKDVCGVDVWTEDSEIKTDIRDFLVWYGTTFWRKRDPFKWVNKVKESLDKDREHVDVALISDVRYPNEGEWIHSTTDGWLVHLTKYWKSFNNNQWSIQYSTSPNKEESKNDPVIKQMSDYKLIWEDATGGGQVKINMEELINDIYLKELVFKSLHACPYLSQKLTKFQNITFV